MKVRLYVEGGPKGVHANGLRSFKNSFKQHLARLDPKLNTLEVSPCGSTEDTIRDYARAVRELGSDCVIAMLVDADAHVAVNTPAKHIAAKLDSAEVPQSARKNIFLMVQCMEAWLVTDLAALEHCYGAKVRDIRFPKNPDIEAVPIKDILAALDFAAKGTPTGRYHKIRDAVKILAELRPDIVAGRSKHAQSLHEFLCQSACS